MYWNPIDRESQPSHHKLKYLDRTQSRFAAARELLIESGEGTSFAGYRCDMQGIGNINTVRNDRQRQLHSVGVFDVHSGQSERALDRLCDGVIIELVYRT